MTVNYRISDRQLQSDVLDTVRVFDDYALDQKTYQNSTYKIKISSRNRFIQYQVFANGEGSVLKILAGNLFGAKIQESQALKEVNLFLTNLNKIINKQIVMTPEIANRDVYKSGRAAIGIISILKLAVAIAAIGFALSILMR